MKTVYECEVCHTLYSVRKEAIVCESDCAMSGKLEPILQTFENIESVCDSVSELDNRDTFNVTSAKDAMQDVFEYIKEIRAMIYDIEQAERGKQEKEKIIDLAEHHQHRPHPRNKIKQQGQG